MIYNKKISKVFFILLSIVVFLTTSDLISNYSSNYEFATICSILSGLFTFIGTALRKEKDLEKGVSKQVDYICNNFNNANIILSILDIICSIIALFTSIVAIGIIFRSAIALRFIITISKVRTVLKWCLMIVAVYLTTRLNFLKKEKIKMWKNMITNIKNNPRTIIFGIICAGVFGYGAYYFSELFFGDLMSLFATITIGICFAVLSFIGCCWIGWDNVKSIVFWVAKKVLNTENYEKLIAFANELMKQQKAEEEAKRIELAEKDSITEQAEKILEENKKALLENIINQLNNSKIKSDTENEVQEKSINQETITN